MTKSMPPTLQLQVRQNVYSGLDVVAQGKLEKFWDKVVLDPYSFVPREEGMIPTLEKIAEENNKIGLFAAKQIRKVCSRVKSIEAIARSGKFKERKFLAVGFGQGWDSGREENPDADWLGDVTRAGLQTWWLDVSSEACRLAAEKTAVSWTKINREGLVFCPPPPVVKRGELSSVFMDPDSVGLELDEVEVFYLCRVLFALSKKSARVVLEIMGSCLSEDNDPEKEKRIILINPFKEDNPKRQTQHSISLSGKQIHWNICRGAGRKLQVEYDAHTYFGRRYTAMIIKAE